MTGVKSGAKLKLSEGHEQFDVPIKPDGAGRMVGTRVPILYLAWFLSQQPDAPVVNDPLHSTDTTTSRLGCRRSGALGCWWLPTRLGNAVRPGQSVSADIKYPQYCRFCR